MHKLIFLLFIGIVSASFVHTTSKPTLPNIVLIYLDDMGYGDLGVTGALEYETPHLDRLAKDGMRFTNFLSVQAVCSASRAALLTGCYPNRIGISGALFPYSKTGIHSEEMTMAELVKQKGYKTSIIGKWHLGDDKKFLPLQHGFDSYYGIPYSNDMWPVWYDGTPVSKEQNANRFQFPTLPIITDNTQTDSLLTLDDQALLTKKYTDRATVFIKQNKNNPFFLYLPHSMPHVPIAASPAFKGKSKQGMYGDVMMEIDWSVGEIIKTLDALKLSQNTIVIFSSDNGPWLNFGNHAGSTSGLREGKGSVWEGGHRVPFIVKWPGVVPSGILSNKLTATIDLFPTIASITGAKLPTHKIDGIDFLPILKGSQNSVRKYLYYYYNRNSLKAVRRDDWKLMLPHKGRTYQENLPGNDGFPGKVNENAEVSLALYDLRRDPGERYNVMDQYPEIVHELQAVAERAREDLGDEIINKEGKNVRLAGKLD